MIKTVTIKACGRPEILRKTLQSIVRDKGRIDWLFYVSADWSRNQDATVKVINDVLSGRANYHVLAGSCNIGYAKNHIKVLKYVFEEKQSDWNLDFDDDYIVMEGWSRLMDYYMETVMKDRPEIFSGHLQSQFPKSSIDATLESAGKDLDWLGRRVRVYSTFGNHGTLLRGSDWRGEYGTWITDKIMAGSSDYEGLTLQWMQERGLLGVRPCLDHIKFQVNDGINFTRKMCLAYNRSMIYVDKAYNADEYSILE